ncbi:MAG TPA: CAP domain-containing protein [Conexivisphaerales archaeon]|nr:CAP domain-containing protein [Conexivisphaerales archaeon]
MTAKHARGSVTIAYLAVAGLLLLVIASILVIAPLVVGDMGPLMQGLDEGVGQQLVPPTNGTTNAPPLLYSSSPLPADYSTLANFTLQLINQDRATLGGLTPVTLNLRLAAQQHAYSMLVNGYLSHWDTQGLKPYMRYTIAGGQGYVAENVAFIRAIGGYHSTASVEDAVKRLEYEMVYNDAAHNNGHRDNILDQYHTGVSVGIAYDSDSVYLVQDFTNDYLNWTSPITMSATGTITLSGTLSGARGVSGDGVQMVQVFFDQAPVQLNVSQLSASPYDGEYDQGTFIAGVVQPGYTVPVGTTVSATQWDVTHAGISLTFSLGQVIRSHGPGCYTLYLAWQNSSGKQELLTSYTIFVTS